MARRPAPIPIVSEDIDRLIWRALGATAAVLVTLTLVIQLWRWLGPK